MLYSILCAVRRFEAYENIGDFFPEVANDILELSVMDKIWAFILISVLKVAERNFKDAIKLLAVFIQRNPVAHALHNIYKNKQVDIHSLAKTQ